MRISDWSSDVCSSDLDAESRPWMACGGESGMDACRAGEHPPLGTPLLPKPVYRPSAQVATIPQPGEDPSFCTVDAGVRSEEGRVGKECVDKWRLRWQA